MAKNNQSAGPLATPHKLQSAYKGSLLPRQQEELSSRFPPNANPSHNLVIVPVFMKIANYIPYPIT